MIGKILKKIRKSLGMTQIYVGKQLGVHRNEISMIETNIRKASVKKVGKMLEFYKEQGQDWGLTSSEEKMLNDFLEDNKEMTKQNIIKYTRMEMIDYNLKGFDYNFKLSEKHKNELYDNLEHEILSFLIKKKYL